MGAGRPKAFLDLGGETLLVRVARSFACAGSIDGIVAVVPEAELELAREQLESIPKVLRVIAGGTRRQDSVLEGLKQAPEGFGGIVLIHDAARPLVELETIESVVEATRSVGAALPVLEVVDTVKRLREGRVVETLDRSELAAAQTPQGFRYSLLVSAYEEAFRQRIILTDEAAALERLGQPVAAVPGSAANRKLTTPEDLCWARGLVQELSQGETE